jgi:hypothetical protein
MGFEIVRGLCSRACSLPQFRQGAPVSVFRLYMVAAENRATRSLKYMCESGGYARQEQLDSGIVEHTVSIHGRSTRRYLPLSRQ